MCDPLTITAVTIGAASSAASIASQNQAARDQADYNNKLGKANNERFGLLAQEVRRDVGFQTDQLYTNFGEQRKAMMMQINNVANDALKSAAIMETGFASAGVEGRSVDQAIREFEVDFSNYSVARIDELDSRYKQMLSEAQAIRNRGQSAINQNVPMPLPPTRMPSPIPAILNGATTAIGVAGALQSLQGPGTFLQGSSAPSGLTGQTYNTAMGNYAQSMFPASSMPTTSFKPIFP